MTARHRSPGPDRDALHALLIEGASELGVMLDEPQQDKLLDLSLIHISEPTRR